ncbi:hypothetical protein DM806_20130 [Sphingobium lactosutens]|uniref:hypothetical protein n=1 Tax=Sphingobium lactosutens TaxID=522773 RepID=UPI0015BE301D|nr:hypothetical protein [Sphingobium lactosutens]NWK97924.1 hypothetical protein [Sphingobium lactosutens]
MSGGADKADQALVDATCDNPLIAKFVLSELVRQNEQSDYIFQKLVKPIHNLLAPLIVSVCCTSEDAPDPDLFFFAFKGRSSRPLRAVPLSSACRIRPARTSISASSCCPLHREDNEWPMISSSSVRAAIR